MMIVSLAGPRSRQQWLSERFRDRLKDVVVRIKPFRVKVSLLRFECSVEACRFPEGETIAEDRRLDGPGSWWHG